MGLTLTLVWELGLTAVESLRTNLASIFLF